jgi:signal transduction histidine kinase
MLAISGIVWGTVAARQWADYPALFWLDIALAVPAFALVFFRRRWPMTVALVLALLGTFSGLAAGPASLAAASVATHRHWRQVIVVGAANLVSAQIFAVVEPTGAPKDPYLLVLVINLTFMASILGWGMYVGSRRELIWTLRQRAERAEAEQELRVAQARSNERARIAREMHDVLAHRVSLVALHAGALEVALDLPPAQVRESAALLRLTAHQALEELRDVIGVLREEPGQERPSTVPQPTLADIPRLVEETRRSGAKIDFEMQVDGAAAAPGPLGRDAYRIVQEALTNISKHARGTLAQVRVAGAPYRGLHVCVRNPPAVGAHDRPAPPGSGTGLLGLQERVTLANGVLVHGPDASGDFVVEADLPW